MSACWGSRVRGGGAPALLGWAVVVMAAIGAAGVNAEPRRVDRVSVGPGGVVVERSGDSDTVHVHVSDREHERYGQGGWIEVDDDGDALVRVFGDIHVPKGKRISDDVVAVFGSVDVEGEVEGDVVAVMGSVRLSEGAIVQGEVVSVGGVVDQDDGASIQGQTVSVGFFPVSWGLPALPLTLSAIAAGWVAAVFAGWLFAIAFPTQLLRVAATASRRTGASLAMGLVSVPGFVALIMLMFVTVVGIPIAILLPFAYIVLVYAGQLAATYLLGCKLTRRTPGSPGLVWPLVAGTLLVAAFFVVSAILFVVPGVTRPLALFCALLGILVAAGLTAIGTGAFLLSRFGTQPKDPQWGAQPAPSMASPLTAPPTSA